MSTGSELEGTTLEFLDQITKQGNPAIARQQQVLGAASSRMLAELREIYTKYENKGTGAYQAQQLYARLRNTKDLLPAKEAKALTDAFKSDLAKAYDTGSQTAKEMAEILKATPDTLKKTAKPNLPAINAAGKRLNDFWAKENTAFRDRVTALTQTALAQGSSYRKLALQVRELLVLERDSGRESDRSARLRKRMGVAGRAELIARTELQTAAVNGKIASFREMGYQWARWSATAERSCPFCISRDGLLYTLDDVEGAIPAHPRCRCSLIPADPPPEFDKRRFEDKGVDAAESLDDAFWARARSEKIRQFQAKNPTVDDAAIRRYVRTPTNSQAYLKPGTQAPAPQWAPSGQLIPNLERTVLNAQRAAERAKQQEAAKAEQQRLEKEAKEAERKAAVEAKKKAEADRLIKQLQEEAAKERAEQEAAALAAAKKKAAEEEAKRKKAEAEAKKAKEKAAKEEAARKKAEAAAKAAQEKAAKEAKAKAAKEAKAKAERKTPEQLDQAVIDARAKLKAARAEQTKYFSKFRGVDDAIKLNKEIIEKYKGKTDDESKYIVNLRTKELNEKLALAKQRDPAKEKKVVQDFEKAQEELLLSQMQRMGNVPLSAAEVAKLTKTKKVKQRDGTEVQEDYLDLADVYKKQKFNGKPELVKDAQALFNRNDLITYDDGINRGFYRGVGVDPKGSNFLDQWQGKGPGGDIHFAGSGIFGNGTYAASPNSSGWRYWREAFDEALGYTMGVGGGAVDTDIGVSANRVGMFGIKRDAKYLDLTQWDGDWNHASFVDVAKRLLKTNVADPGELAAALGYETVKTQTQAGNTDQEFWIILNRAKVVSIEGDISKHVPRNHREDESGMPGVNLTKKMSEERLGKPIKKIDQTDPEQVVDKWQASEYGMQEDAILANLADLAPNAGKTELKAWKASNLPKYKQIKEDFEDTYSAEKASDPYSPSAEIFEALLSYMGNL